MTITINNALLILCLFYFGLSCFLFYLLKRVNLFFKVIVFCFLISTMVVIEQTDRIEVTLSALMGFFVIYREKIFEILSEIRYFFENLFFTGTSILKAIFNGIAWILKLFSFLIPSRPAHQQNQNYQEQAYQSQSSNRNNEQRSQAEQDRQRQHEAEQERIREAKEELKRQREKAKNQDNRSPEEILGLHDGFSLSDLRMAYKQAVSRYHPDKYSHMSESFQKEAETELKKVQQAYNQLLKKFN